MARKPLAAVAADHATEAEAVPLSERRTDEIVIALVGAVASGVSYTSHILGKMLESDYGYVGKVIKLSSFINKYASAVGHTPVTATDPERVVKLQEIGNQLRQRFGSGCIAELGVRDINLDRGEPHGLPRARRHYTILDSIKNPEEAEVLREVYQDALCVIGVFAPESVRRKRLKKELTDAYVAKVFEQDQADGLPFGQNVRGTMELADFYVRNDGENDVRLRASLARFLEILFGVGVHTPTKDELAMQAAFALASGSACLSRQVGAVVVNESGDIIGHGRNDVPKFGGGLYTTEDGERDHRCWKWKSKECHNDACKRRLLDDVEERLASAGVLSPGAEGVKNAVAGAGVKNLIEFSRSVHAEMDAIISVARTGNGGIVGSTLYTSTFPCHSCARHIVASGIRRVFYIEPYPKSLALDLHDDSISVDDADEGKKVVFLQFNGVAPRNMLRLFSQHGERKHGGKVAERMRADASPVCKAPLDGFETREQLIVAKLKDIGK